MIGAFLALLALFIHSLTASRYGYFRDELYFIACAKHLAWGYVDQPPMVALAAWLAAAAGYQLLALRALPILAAAATVYLASQLTRELGGRAFAQLLAGTATLLMPAYLLLGNTLTTSSFEPLFWTVLFYCAVRIVRRPKPKAALWVGTGVAIAVGSYAKYSMLLAMGAIVAGLIATPQRRILASPLALITVGIAAALLAPNVAWQTIHGWPIIEVLRGDATHRPAFSTGLALEYVNALSNAPAFAIEQLVYANPLAAPLWIAGLIAPWRSAALRDLRFVTIAYLVIFLVAVASSAKGYYVSGIYATLFAVGAVVVERAALAVRVTLFALLAALGLLAMPLALPVLSIDTLVGYTKALGLTGRNGTPAHLIQPLFAEEFGWQRLAQDVAHVYFSLPPRERARTAIYADTYGDAGALDFFGPRYALPPPISSQNNYYLWGTRGYDGATLVAIGATRIARLRRFYRSVALMRVSTEPYKWVVEGPAPIYLCRDPIAPLSAIWPQLRWYGA